MSDICNTSLQFTPNSHPKYLCNSWILKHKFKCFEFLQGERENVTYEGHNTCQRENTVL